MNAAPQTRDWTPWRVDGYGADATVAWCHTQGVTFDEPFFRDTIDRCLRHPFRLLFQRVTTIDDLIAYADAAPGLPIGGLIFHMSRCGSTLVARMLAAVPEHHVISEPVPLDELLRATRGEPGELRRRAATAMVTALAQPRVATQRRAFIKLDAWTTTDLALLRQCLPDVPWLFLYRDPVEVLDSHARRLAGHTVRGAIDPALFGLEAADIDGLSPIAYAARVLARIGEAALVHRDDPLATFVDYRQLPEFVTTELAQRWNLPLTDATMAAMHAVATQDAKNPSIPFDAARPALRPADAAAVNEAAEEWLRPVCDALAAI